MIETSAAFAALLDTAPFRLHLALADGTEVPQIAVKSAEWSGGSNAGDDITLGSTVAVQLKAELDKEKLGGLDLTDKDVAASLTIDGADNKIPVASLRVDGVTGDDDKLTVSACDAMVWAFSADYALDDEALGFDWDAGVDAETLLRAICEERGVELATDNLPAVQLRYASPSGYTYREIIAFLACLWGRFARIDGLGRLTLQWYANINGAVETVLGTEDGAVLDFGGFALSLESSDAAAPARRVGPERYYDGELTLAAYEYTVGYIKCYAEPLEETLQAGDASKAQGISIKCPWMTQERLNAVWADVGGFTYRPVTGLRFLGDPRLEPGDMIRVAARDGQTYTVPCMTVRHEYDGGIITEVSAAGKSESASAEDYEGPVTRKIERAKRDISVQLIKYENRIEESVKNEISDAKAEFDISLDDISQRISDGEARTSEIETKVDGIRLETATEAGADGQVYARITIKIGPNAYSGYIKMEGNVDVSGQLSADALYAALGDIADLTVSRLSTSRRIVKYLARDDSDDNYVRIHEQYIEFVTGSTDGSTEQAVIPSGLPIYWEDNPDGADLGADGYPYRDGERIFTTTAETPWPVMVYKYQEAVKRSIGFENIDGVYTPVDTFGAGNPQGRHKSTLVKGMYGLKLMHLSDKGDIGFEASDEGYLDLYGLRKTTALDFSGWDSGTFMETVEGIAEPYSYKVEFDGQGRPVKITDDNGHEMAVTW